MFSNFPTRNHDDLYPYYKKKSRPGVTKNRESVRPGGKKRG